MKLKIHPNLNWLLMKFPNKLSRIPINLCSIKKILKSLDKFFWKKFNSLMQIHKNTHNTLRKSFSNNSRQALSLINHLMSESFWNTEIHILLMTAFNQLETTYQKENLIILSATHFSSLLRLFYQVIILFLS